MIDVATIQMVSTDTVATNLAVAEALIKEAALKQATLIALPENFAQMAKKEQDTLATAEPFGTGKIQSFLSQQAAQHQIWLLGGTIPLQTTSPERAFAASLLYDPNGECIACYHKIHLFDVLVLIDGQKKESYQESNTFEAGNKPTIAKTAIGTIGLSVCYDLRFPELYRHLNQEPINIITVPAAFTETTGAAHWETLLKARAIENLCYVIAPNQGGVHTNGRNTWGHSMIIDPWGTILAQVGQGAGIALATIDLAKQAKLRQTFPVLSHTKINHKLNLQ